jgi:hypothetical protein
MILDGTLTYTAVPFLVLRVRGWNRDASDPRKAKRSSPRQLAVSPNSHAEPNKLALIETQHLLDAPLGGCHRGRPHGPYCGGQNVFTAFQRDSGLHLPALRADR